MSISPNAKPLYILTAVNTKDEFQELRQAVAESELVCHLTHARTTEATFKMLDSGLFEMALIDIGFSDGAPLDIIRKIKDQWGIPVIFLLTPKHIDIAIEAIRLGAYDYLTKDETSAYLKLLPTILRKTYLQAKDRAAAYIFQQALLQSEAKHRQILEQTAHSVFMINERGRLEYVNRSATQLSGYDSSELIGMPYYKLLPDKQWKNTIRDFYMNQTKNPAEEKQIEHPLKIKTGEIIWISQTITTLLDEGEFSGFQGIAWDVTEKVKAEQARKKAESRYRALFERTNDAVLIMNLNREHIAVNQAAADMLGYTIEELLGTNSRQILDPNEVDHSNIRYAELVQGKIPPTYERTFIRKDGERIFGEVTSAMVFDEDGKPTHIQSIVRDITERKELEDQLRHLANHDVLTGLPNRYLFNNQLELSLHRARRNNYQIAVMFVDLDGFKEINDAFGHENGDILLKTIATRLRNAVRKTDIVARMGGDEFTLILEGVDNEIISNIAQKSIDEIRKPVDLGPTQGYVSASIGISVYPNDGRDVESLLVHADQAMYAAKEEGNGNYRFFDTKQ